MIATAAGERQQEMDPPSCTSERSARERLEPAEPVSSRQDLARSVH